MKRKIIALAAVLAMSLSCLAGCGSTGETAAPAQTDEPAVEEQTGEVAEVIKEEPEAEPEEAPAGEDEPVGMANPWVEITEDEAKTLCPRLFKAPDGATDLLWQKCEALGDPANDVGPLVELDFKYDGMDFNARAQYGISQDDDISGVYADWEDGPDYAVLANWGGGNMEAKFYREVRDDGYTDLITWYDIEIGIGYSLSVSAPDLDGFDIQAVAEQMYCAENEPNVD